ncbi:MAG: tRNA (adenosine(37)-N6)-threonylcarbamoyltransferase complex dimerization subunit type 1 TsaB [Defluviitaleaceae bacterium]|nr:tRNA (adenosine(37)-N6)-threonylcarbamoyltransferase complex dimerization subunit type 1 TsaB [Defluviitaleaceae bacterium]
MIKILAIDTSGEQAGVAIVAAKDAAYITVGEVTLNARTGEKAWTHSEILMPAVEQLFELTRLSPSDIDFVAYSNGPGSFTGLRIGAASALGIARSLNIPAIPVPTIDALAYNVLGTGDNLFIVPMLDARRGQVYTAIYFRNDDGTIERIMNFMALPVVEFLSYFVDSDMYVVFLGDGADANAEVIRAAIPNAIFAPANNNRQRASSVGVWAIEKILAGCEFSKDVEILYVRAPQAVREAERKILREREAATSAK